MMARKVGKMVKNKQKEIKCPSCNKKMHYVVVMPHKKTQLKCECGKHFTKSLKEV